jgi:predicted PurR-regulated permease PerM
VNALVSLFGGLATVVSGLVLSFYILLEEPRAKVMLKQVIPDKERYDIIYSVMKRISRQLGSWVRGQLTIMLIVAVLNTVVFALLGLPSPLALGSWAGLFW